MRLNKLLLRLKQLQWEMQTGHLKICFGTKKLLKAGSKEFALRRDSRMSYMGSQDETARNQMLQLEYHNRTNQFAIKLRKDFGADEKEKYVYGKCYFNHHKNKLIHILSNANSSPLTYVILRRAGRYLDFKNTKAKAVQGKSEKGKKYNQMLHTLAYSMYDQLVSDISFRNRVYVEKVNPAQY